MPKTVVPVLGAESYSCPHCGALAHQDWFKCYAKDTEEPPETFDESKVEDRIRAVDPHIREPLRTYVNRILAREIFFEAFKTDVYNGCEVANLNLSQCYSCKSLSVWLYDRVLWPENFSELVPAADMPATIVSDFMEAATIVDKSPRGAAAILRLCVQKLCLHLGEKGKNIDDDIASLVGKGLDVRIQRALDVVRVVGNEAVHPGTIDLSDDRGTAIELFGLLNFIVEAMITQPKRVDELYSKLPVGKLKAIERRDAQTKDGTKKS